MLFWVCLCLWSVLGSLFFCIVSWICQLCWGCKGQLWWSCNCCCFLGCCYCLGCWCCCWWWLWPGWDVWIYVPIGWVPRQGIGSGGGLFWYVRVPCPNGLVLKKLFLPYVLGCCIHFVWLWCGGCCPSEGIGLYVLVFCTLRCWRCCLVVLWLVCPGRVMILVVWALLWTVCVGPGCWCVEVGPDCVLPCW